MSSRPLRIYPDGAMEAPTPREDEYKMPAYVHVHYYTWKPRIEPLLEEEVLSQRSRLKLLLGEPIADTKHPNSAYFLDLFFDVQQTAEYLQQSVRYVAINQHMRQDVARELRRCGTALTGMVPMLLSMIEELSGRLPQGTARQYTLSASDMEQLTEACANMEHKAKRLSALNGFRRRAEIVPVNGFVDTHFVDHMTSLANQLEELPIKIRGTFMDLRTMDDQATYKFFQDFLLYQGTGPTTSAKTYSRPIPLVLSYLGPTLSTWADDMRSIRYNGDGTATLPPNHPDVATGMAGQFGVGSSSGFRA